MRLFIAVNFPPQLRRSIHAAAAPLRATDVPARWTAPEHIHLTIRFLGETAEAAIGGLEAAVTGAARSVARLSLRFEHFGAFPGPSRPRVLWLGVEASPELRFLRQDLEERLVELGLPRENREFHPHVTIGRVKQGVVRSPAPVIPRRGVLPAALTVPHPVRCLDLVRSRLTRNGPEYEILHRADVGGASLADEN